jgi:type II secretory pathway pseudopilin PulG
MKRKFKDQKGFSMVTILFLLLMMTILGIAALTTSDFDLNLTGNQKRSTNAFYAAEAGIKKAESKIRTSYISTGSPPSPLPSGNFSLNDYSITYNTTDLGPAVQMTLTAGAYRGLYGLVKSFEITSEAVGNPNPERAKIVQVIEDALVPIFQFAVFYQSDLEIYPGPIMTLGGRVHSNGNMYLGSENALYVNSYCTAALDIFYGRKPGLGMAGADEDVFIKDNYGNYQNIKNPDGTELDSNDPDWVANSLARWGGLVEDQSHGMTELNLPVVAAGEPVDMIEREQNNPDSYELKAGLKIVGGTASYKTGTGTWQDVTSTLTSDGTLTTKTFYNAREQKNVTSYDIDISKLNTSGYFPSNGIIYASRVPVTGTEQAVRLVNGSTLAAPLTVATSNPLYIQGSYNTVSKKPAAVFTDALTILSNSRNDANSTKSLSNRVASNTIANVSFLTGNTNSQNSHYGGGLENLPRFLEKWDGKSFTYRGSMIDLWFSQQATGIWSYGSYYTAPNRDWAFDVDLLNPANLPPGTPLVNIVQNVSWLRKTAE